MEVEIPKHEWKDALQGFSSQHKGWLVRVVESAVLPPRFSSDYAPLSAIACEERAGQLVVEIVVDPVGEGPSTHSVEEPVELYIQRADGDDAGLEIVSRDGTRTVLEFRSALATDLIDSQSAP